MSFNHTHLFNTLPSYNIFTILNNIYYRDAKIFNTTLTYTTLTYFTIITRITTSLLHLITTKYTLKHTPKRCPGPSGLTHHALRNLPPNIIHVLTHLYNASLACGYFPIPFKIANVTLIPKPNNPRQNPPTIDPSAYLTD